MENGKYKMQDGKTQNVKSSTARLDILIETEISFGIWNLEFDIWEK